MAVSGQDELAVLVDRLRWDRRRDPYSGGRAYSQAARDGAYQCEQLIAADDASVAIPVLRKAVDRMTNALMYLDSSSGVLGNDLDYLMELYAKACGAAPPASKTLASWLVKVVCDGPGWPDVRLHEWVPALGVKGLASMAELVEQRRLAADPQSWTGRWAVRHLREQLAAVSGDVDRHVAVLAEHLESAQQYCRIVQVLAAAGRPAEAIEWARQGLTAEGSSPSAAEMRELYVRLLFQTDQPQAAVDERLTEFERVPTTSNCQSLLATAEQAESAGDHVAWALDLLRERAKQQIGALPHLVDVLILAGREDEAWRTGLERFAELGDRQRLELLELRQPTHPAEVTEPYRRLIDARLVDSLDKRRYDKAISMLRRLRDAHRTTGDIEQFKEYIAGLRVEHRRRPTFLSKLDAARL